jgi:predicted nucleic acid-binding protein
VPKSLHRLKTAGQPWQLQTAKARLEVDLRSRFSGRILPVDAAVADRWGLLAAQAKRNGTPLPIIDGLLAATALHHNLTLVSRNVTGFATAQVPVLNPWEALWLPSCRHPKGNDAGSGF